MDIYFVVMRATGRITTLTIKPEMAKWWMTDADNGSVYQVLRVKAKEMTDPDLLPSATEEKSHDGSR